MSNLGLYQMMTTAAKKVKGPLNLFFLTAGGGYVFGKICERGGKIVYKKLKQVHQRNNVSKKAYDVNGIYSSEDGLELTFGDKYVVLERDGESVLIEKLGDTNNPYVVPTTILQGISALH